jgi:peptide/nickel transport system ATP-binding protein
VEKKHILLEGDIPSAMNPPSGCPFQTRCPRKHLVPGDLCDREVPPMRKTATGHDIKCHLSDAVFAEMEPVIKLRTERLNEAAAVGEPG